MDNLNCEVINEGGRKLSVAKGSLIGIAIGGLITGIGYVGGRLCRKLVDNKKKEPENKYEDKYEYIVV